MTSPIPSLLLVGCGKMGGALRTRWQQHNAAHIDVIDPEQTGKDCHQALSALSPDYVPDVVVFAVKPQVFPELLPDYRTRFGDKPLYLSIAAGKTLSFFQKHLGNVRIVRAMPNTPALIGAGVTVLCATSNVGADEKKLAETLLQAVGNILWLGEEKMDAVTAVSGSGPAYVFLFLEALTKAGITQGLDEQTSRKLALETVAGAAALARESGEHFDALRKNVTSPGGTTEAALKVLMQGGALEHLVGDAVAAAAKKSKELAGQPNI